MRTSRVRLLQLLCVMHDSVSLRQHLSLPFIHYTTVFTHIFKHKSVFAISNSVEKQAHLLKLPLKYSSEPAQRTGHMASRLPQTLAE